ncbi:hypothetical protein [Chroococcidiopsis sp.]
MREQEAGSRGAIQNSRIQNSKFPDSRVRAGFDQRFTAEVIEFIY